MIDGLGLGENAKECFVFVRDVMRGQVPDPRNPALMLDIPITVRLQAAVFLIEKRTGKAPATMDIDVNHSGEVTHRHGNYDLSRYSEAELFELEKLLNTGAVDGEIVEPADLPEANEDVGSIPTAASNRTAN